MSVKFFATVAPVSVPVCVSFSEVAEDETSCQGALAVSPWGGPFSCPPKGRHMKSPRRYVSRFGSDWSICVGVQGESE